MRQRIPTGAELQSLEGCLCLTLRRTARAVTQHYDAALRSFGVRATQLPILTAAARHAHMPLAQMADVLGMERTTLLRNVRPLVRQGLITIRREKGGRRDLLSATAAGQALLVRLYPAWRAVQDRLLSELKDHGLRQTLGDLGRSIQAERNPAT
jgi:DNA-binding MarR family transcriptional regulator